MDNKPHISIFLDTRRPKRNGKFPVKLRVYTSTPKVQKLYPTIFDYSEEEFEAIYLSPKPKEELKEKRRELQSIADKASDIAKEIKPFSIERFEKKYSRGEGEGVNVFYHYQNIIDGFNKKGQVNTASNYELSLKSIKSFVSAQKGNEKEVETFSLYEVTPQWLNDYENFMTNPHSCELRLQKNFEQLYKTKPKEKSLTTVSMYLRALRAVYNSAISDDEIDKSFYPFGKKKYQVPAVRKVKKALTNSELKKLFEAKPHSKEQEKARDFWFFSYSCNGINIKDIAQLKYGSLQKDSFNYYRAKTFNTSKGDLKPITVYLTDFSKQVIEKYGNENKNPNNYVFSIIDSNQTPLQQRTSIKNFTRFINQNIKKLAVKNNISSDISSYWARHSMATQAIKNGASMEFVSEALNHSNLKVTQGYFAGFEDKHKKEITESLMRF